MTIGIKWNDQEARVPESEKKWLRSTLSGYVRAGVKVKDLPSTLGQFSICYGTNARVLDFNINSNGLFQRFKVGDLIDNPSTSGIPSDGSVTRLDYIEAPQSKPKLETKEHPSFGWNPYED